MFRGFAKIYDMLNHFNGFQEFICLLKNLTRAENMQLEEAKKHFTKRINLITHMEVYHLPQQENMLLTNENNCNIFDVLEEDSF